MKASRAGMHEVALGLAEALLPALRAGAPALAAVAARDVARLMGLSGLEAALAELARHPRAPWPVDVENVAARIGRIAATAAHDGELSGFQDADRELGMLAAQLAATEWSEPGTESERSVATIPAGEAFADLALDAPAEALLSRLTVTVASAVRAAVDWLGADESRRAVLDVHDSALTLTVTATHEGGIGPAGAVLAGVEGSLGREADGRWTIRVATSSERTSYLLLRQGRHGVALPWHAVARLRMFAPHELERLPEPRLEPLSTGPVRTGELPAALVALGLARAWFVADRIVWRIAARAGEAGVAGPFAGSTRAVEVESGERYWVLEPAWLLRGTAPPQTPPPSPRPRSGAAAPPSPPASPLAAVPLPPAPPAPAPEPAMALAPAGESLAEAVERALAQLRRERGVAAAPEQRHEEPAPAPEPEWTGEDAADAVMFSAAVDVISPAPAPERQAPAPGTAAEPRETVPPEAATPALDDAEVAALLDTLLPAPAIDAPVPAPPPAAVPERALRPSELAARVPVRRALVADDSLVARIFLARLLEKRGWVVETVPDAASLWDQLHHGSWALVCADFAMPDAQGAGHVARLVEFLGRRAVPTPCVVLTRDAADERTAREAGATLVLRKPFDPQRLDALLPH